MKWEYWVIHLDQPANQQTWTEALDQQGKQGWELISIVRQIIYSYYSSSDYYVATFKRPIGKIDNAN